ncbi:MAG: Uma2 family endonuclease [Deltaproteobacteria bacterium]|nr:Uma2 family endonuclease [Deltaproteobacteria bacterium]
MTEPNVGGIALLSKLLERTQADQLIALQHTLPTVMNHETARGARMARFAGAVSAPRSLHKFTLVPDWVCEVLSPSTSSHDTIVKMPRYLEAGVKWAWIIDPVAERLDIFRAGDGEWLEAGSHQGAGAARLEPFDAVELDLGPCWQAAG